MLAEVVRVTEEAVRMLLEAVRVIIKAIRKIITVAPIRGIYLHLKSVLQCTRLFLHFKKVMISISYSVPDSSMTLICVFSSQNSYSPFTVSFSFYLFFFLYCF